MNPLSLNDTLLIQYSYTAFTFGATLKELSEDQAFVQPEPGGNCINWVAGHIVETRGTTLGVLEVDLPFAAEKYARYKRSSEPIQGAEGAVALQEMITDFADTRKALATGLQNLTLEQSAAEALFSPFNRDGETVGSLLAGLFFHEAYHIGQLGLLRRLVGEEGIVK